MMLLIGEPQGTRLTQKKRGYEGLPAACFHCMFLIIFLNQLCRIKGAAMLCQKRSLVCGFS